jgi:hypothetical protein
MIRKGGELVSSESRCFAFWWSSCVVSSRLSGQRVAGMHRFEYGVRKGFAHLACRFDASKRKFRARANSEKGLVRANRANLDHKCQLNR